MTHHEDSDSIQIVPDPDKLDRYHRQQLSAMLDGELSPDQARFMLRRLQHDADLAGCWERWQVCGDVLRGQRNALLPGDFSQKVAVAIAADGAPPSQARAHSGGPRLLRWGGGAALAASVAMAALLVGRQAGLEPDQASTPLPQLAASSEPARPAPTPATTDPAPARAPATDTAAMLAGTALAAAEVPRRAAERRERVQERGPVTAQGAANPPRLVAAAAPDPSPARTAPIEQPRAPVPALPTADDGAASLFAGLTPARGGIGADPFRALPMDVDSRPWPRASAAAGGYSVGFGNAVPVVPAWPSAPASPRRQAVAELFGLPPEAALRLPAATAIGVRAIGAGEGRTTAPATPEPGTR